MPLQSDHMPIINVYFLISIWYTFVALCWFTAAEYLKSKETLPSFLISIVNFCQKILKSLSKNNSKIKITEKITDVIILDSCVMDVETVDKRKEIKTKQTLKEKMNYLKSINILVFLWILISEVVCYMVIWISLSLK